MCAEGSSQYFWTGIAWSLDLLHGACSIPTFLQKLQRLVWQRRPLLMPLGPLYAESRAQNTLISDPIGTPRGYV